MYRNLSKNYHSDTWETFALAKYYTVSYWNVDFHVIYTELGTVWPVILQILWISGMPAHNVESVQIKLGKNVKCIRFTSLQSEPTCITMLCTNAHTV